MPIMVTDCCMYLIFSLCLKSAYVCKCLSIITCNLPWHKQHWEKHFCTYNSLETKHNLFKYVVSLSGQSDMPVWGKSRGLSYCVMDTLPCNIWTLIINSIFIYSGVNIYIIGAEDLFLPCGVSAPNQPSSSKWLKKKKTQISLRMDTSVRTISLFYIW